MTTLDLALFAVALLAFALVSARLEQAPLTAPMLFVALGLAAGPAGLAVVDIPVAHDDLHLLAEVTLVLVLFTDASRIRLPVLVRDHGLPVRMLAFGLPLTVILGAVMALAVFGGLGLAEAVLLAAILAPTDAALGQAVVGSAAVPLRVRQALNVESGLNDGIALPLVVTGVAVAAESHGQGSYWAGFVALQLIVGPLAGIAVGLAGTRLLDGAQKRGWVNETFLPLALIALAPLAYEAAHLGGGNGFMAAFCAGLTVGNTAHHLCPALFAFGEEEGQILALAALMLFGAVMVPESLAHLTWPMVAFAILALTVQRMVPVALSLRGCRLKASTVLFLGWFGPRGLASILFALLLVDASGLEHARLIVDTAVLTVLLSVFAHGASAGPLAALYGRHASPESHTHEHAPVEALPLRHGRHRRRRPAPN